MTPLQPVCLEVARLLDADRDKALEILDSICATHERDPRGYYHSSLHTWWGPIDIRWKGMADEAPRAILHLGRMAGIPGRGQPSLDGSRLLLDTRALDGVPDTILNAMAGRRLGELAMFENAFLDRLANVRVLGIGEGEDGAPFLMLDVEMVQWDHMQSEKT